MITTSAISEVRIAPDFLESGTNKQMLVDRVLKRLLRRNGIEATVTPTRTNSSVVNLLNGSTVQHVNKLAEENDIGVVRTDESHNRVELSLNLTRKLLEEFLGKAEVDTIFKVSSDAPSTNLASPMPTRENDSGMVRIVSEEEILAEIDEIIHNNQPLFCRGNPGEPSEGYLKARLVDVGYREQVTGIFTAKGYELHFIPTAANTGRLKMSIRLANKAGAVDPNEAGEENLVDPQDLLPPEEPLDRLAQELGTPLAVEPKQNEVVLATLATITPLLGRIATALEQKLPTSASVAKRMVEQFKAEGGWLFFAEANGDGPISMKEMDPSQLQELFERLLSSSLPK